MLPLILEPQKWERPDLLELGEGLNAGLAGIHGAFSSGTVFKSGWMAAPDPARLDTAMNLLQAVVDLYSEAKGPASTNLTLVRMVNLQYQTLLTVMWLVPGPTIPEGNRMRKAARDSDTPPKSQTGSIAVPTPPTGQS
jgi:hypothetical protein